jgi:ribosomal protein S18 acetylase RimI-like enzyme
MIEILEFDSTHHTRLIRTGTVELQDLERSLDPRKPSGESIADRYVEHLHEQCRKHAGSILVAHYEGQPAGFVVVWTQYRSPDLSDSPEPQAYVPDRVVLAKYRRRGIARALMRAAEARAREAGSPCIGLFVSAADASAQALYASEGFRSSANFLEKPLP